ncbi:hypothetical protein [Pseudokordiimonas caeni]|uniref:hypothetical protein n=1 Tax=Pseudokordiimonas caeni TaxID=2997908 RepID=UPI0028124DFD|nr:hypothetical protein [Pseudokordiimonas caeni]
MTPLISFVGFARNDGYVEGYEDRLRSTVGMVEEQARKFGICVEYILVEWNPPFDRPALHEIFAGYTSGANFSLRIITVPSTNHRGFRGAAEREMHPGRALNVGFRRARGRFITSLSSDVFLSDGVFQYLSTEELNDDAVYRLDRYDVDPEKTIGLAAATSADREAMLAAAVVQHHGTLSSAMAAYYGLKPLHTNACGDFMLMGREIWHGIRGVPENCSVACLEIDSLALHAAVASGAREILMPDDCRLYKIAHNRMTSRKVTLLTSGWRMSLARYLNRSLKSAKLNSLIRGLLDAPQRKVEGLAGVFPSMERNFVVPALYWHWRGKQVCLNGRGWGLNNVSLDERVL